MRMEAGQLALIPADSCKLQHFGGNQENPHMAGSDLGKGEGKQDQGQDSPGGILQQRIPEGSLGMTRGAVMHCPAQPSKNALSPSGHG